MHRRFWDLMKQWSQPEHNNVVVVSEYKSGGEEWRVIADQDWEDAKSGKKKKKKTVRRHSDGRPTEKMFVWKQPKDDMECSSSDDADDDYKKKSPYSDDSDDSDDSE
jgi:hypothetical protein